jgi:alpha-L-fucosidase
LFIHWGISSVRDLDISWPMITGWGLATLKLGPEEIERVVRERDYSINSRRPVLTPDEYWSTAREFDPKKYDPEPWIEAAKEAGFTYAVFTAKRHEGFAMWPGKYGEFSTRNYMGGRDLVRPFVEACRKHGSDRPLNFRHAGDAILIDLPAKMRTNLVDVVEVNL